MCTLGLSDRVLVTGTCGVALDVQHIDIRLRKLRLRKRPRGHVGQSRRRCQANLNHALNAQALRGSAEEQILRLNPANRRRKLPREELDEQGACGGLRVSDRFIPIVDDLLSCLRGNNVKDRLSKISSELEGTSNQVRDVASFKNLEVDVLGKQRIELVTEGRDSSTQA